MLKTVIVDTARLDTGHEFSLARRGDEWMVRAGTLLLMSSRTHASEDSLAEHGLAGITEPRNVLVGGLGLGYTLRAVLDRVGPNTRVTVAELVPALVDWNRTHVGGLAGNPLDDARTEVVVGDVFELLQRSPHAFDAVLLDVDNGPTTLSNARNQRLYGTRGVQTCRKSLRAGGMLAVWSAGPNARYERTLRAAGLQVETLRVSAFTTGSSWHLLFLATAEPKPSQRGADGT